MSQLISTAELVTVLAVRDIQSNPTLMALAGVGLPWELIASHIYCATQLLLSPRELRRLYLRTLAANGGSIEAFLVSKVYQTASQRLAAWSAEDVRREVGLHHDSALRKLKGSGAGGGGKTTSGSHSAVLALVGMPTAAAGAGGPANSFSGGSGGSGGNARTPSPVASFASSIPTSFFAVTSKESLLLVWNRCNGLKMAEWFREAVNPETMMVHAGSELGPWRKVIKKSLSINGIRTMIQTGEITTLVQLRNAFLQVAANSVMFNAPQGDYPPAARIFARGCSEVFESLGNSNSGSNFSSMSNGEPPSALNGRRIEEAIDVDDSGPPAPKRARK
jgi:hypothetical protein